MSNLVEQDCMAILQQPCMYTASPFSYMNGHQFCPCVCKAIRTAYVGGYRAAKTGQEPEVGIETIDPKDAQ
jgi:hypothetical protein